MRRVFLILVLLVLPTGGQAAPKADLWERWLAHDPSSITVVDHRPWARFLRLYVRSGPGGVNRVNYAGVSASDRQSLETHVETLARTRVSKLNRDEQRAYWINLYNALTVKVILDHFPVDSITDIDISPGLFASGPWGKKLLRIEGEEVSLDDIEHRILRPIWKDERIHYAVNCAAVGCPNLAQVPYTADNTESLLEKGARDYINHRRGARFERGGLVASKIYDWYTEDFGGTERGVIRHLKRYARGELRAMLSRTEDIDDYRYDWSLNALN